MPLKFENLRVWVDAVELSGIVSDVASKFPNDERYVLATQVKRAADSVSLNIAEGSTGQSDPEFKRFLGMSIRSGIEVIGAYIWHAAERSFLMKTSRTSTTSPTISSNESSP